MVAFESYFHLMPAFGERPSRSRTQKEFERMEKGGVVFKANPIETGPVSMALFADPCGNLLQRAGR